MSRDLQSWMWCICESTVGRSKQTRGWLGAAYHSAALLTGSGPALSPHSSNRCLTGKIFSQLEREGRGIICFTIHHSGSGENRREKPTCMILYCPWVSLHRLKTDPGKFLQIVYYLLSNILQNSLGSCIIHLSHEHIWMMNVGKGSRFPFVTILIWCVWWYDEPFKSTSIHLYKNSTSPSKRTIKETREKQFSNLILMFVSHVLCIWQNNSYIFDTHGREKNKNICISIWLNKIYQICLTGLLYCCTVTTVLTRNRQVLHLSFFSVRKWEVPFLADRDLQLLSLRSTSWLHVC